MGASVDHLDPPPGAVRAAPPRRRRGAHLAPWHERAHHWVLRHALTLTLVGTLCVGAVLRLVNLNAYGFNSDEAVYAGQAASLAGNPDYVAQFPVFRAHPMLVQSLLSVVYRSGEHDVVGRVVIASIGVLTLYVVHRLGVELYSRRVGVLAAAVLAVMPYHVMVTRQVLLDGPMVLFSTLTLLLVARFAKTGRLSWMLAAGAALGLTMLCKESSIVLVGAVYAFFALTPAVRRPVVGSLMGIAVALGLFALHPLSVALAGHASTTKAYLVWQLMRRPNHGYGFYVETVPWAIGPVVLLFAALAVWLVRRRRQPMWRELLLLSWILTPALAFTIWPVKGFQYLLPAAPAVAVLAARGLTQLPRPARLPRQVAAVPVARIRLAAAAVTLGSLALVTLPVVSPHASATGLAGTGGIPGGREAGRWIDANTPQGSVLMTLGPSMANLVAYYGHRSAYGLSVSPNPLHRNPSYVPIANPDFSLRHGDMQYVVWDMWSARRSQHFSETLLGLVRRFHGRLVRRETAVIDGNRTAVIKIYEVRS